MAFRDLEPRFDEVVEAEAVGVRLARVPEDLPQDIFGGAGELVRAPSATPFQTTSYRGGSSRTDDRR